MSQVSYLRITLIRHGQTDWNLEERIQGQIDICLNHNGKYQSQCLYNYLKDEVFDRLLTSPLKRARETAEIILGDRLLNLELVPSLQEISHGDWEGRLESELSQLYAYQFHLWKTDPLSCCKPNGETLHQFRERVVSAWEKLIQECFEDCYRNILVVAHKFTIQVILCHICGLDINLLDSFPQENCAINIINYHNGNAKLEVMNLTVCKSVLTVA